MTVPLRLAELDEKQGYDDEGDVEPALARVDARCHRIRFGLMVRAFSKASTALSVWPRSR